MRFLVVAGLVSGLMSAGMVSAQDQAVREPAAKKRTQRVARQKTAKSKTANQPVLGETVAVPVQVSEPAESSRIAPSADSGTNTASIKKATQEAQPKKWNFNFFTQHEATLDSYNSESTNDFGASERARIGYKVTPQFSMQLASEWERSYGARDQDAKFKFTDPYLGAVYTNVANVGGVGLNTAMRLYFPASEASQMKDQIAAMRFYATLAKKFGPVSLSYTIEPRYYAAPSDYVDTSKNPNVKTANMFFSLRNYGELGISITPKLQFAQMVGIRNNYYHDSAGAKNSAVETDYFLADTNLTYQFNPVFGLTAGVYSDEGNLDLRKQDREFSMYRSDESLLYLAGDVNF